MKCDGLEELWLENYNVTARNRKTEEKLYERVCVLEEENKNIMKEMERVLVNQENADRRVDLCKEHSLELTYMHNMMVIKINTVITELNNVISILSNKDQEN